MLFKPSRFVGEEGTTDAEDNAKHLQPVVWVSEEAHEPGKGCCSPCVDSGKDLEHGGCGEEMGSTWTLVICRLFIEGTSTRTQSNGVLLGWSVM